jgi:hypothetical protein
MAGSSPAMTNGVVPRFLARSRPGMTKESG